LAIYGDDLLIANNNLSQLSELKEKLKNRFKMTDMGELTYYLGIKVESVRENNQIYLSQSLYIEQALTRFAMSERKPVSTPQDVHTILKAGEEGNSIHQGQYREIVGTLMYLMTSTRPDLAWLQGTWADS
jgi:hypothetical protein